MSDENLAQSSQDSDQPKDSRMSDAREMRSVTADGRVVIPFSIQLALGIENGGQVCFVLENGRVTLESTAINLSAGLKSRPASAAGWADIKAELNALLDAASKARVSEPVRIIE